MGLTLDARLDGLEGTLGDELITPTRIYVKTILNLLRDFELKGMAHITGGGLLENIPRVLPRNCRVDIDTTSWPKPAIFELLREGGNVSSREMYRTFNYGIGMAVIVPAAQADDILVRLGGLGEKAYQIGKVAACEECDDQVILQGLED